MVADRTRELNRLQKMLEGVNIKLSETVAEINGMNSQGSWNTNFFSIYTPRRLTDPYTYCIYKYIQYVYGSVR